MATTSLAEQLQRLSAPQTTLYKEDKKTASLLFDPKEAALKDRSTFYEIGLSGLRELIALYEGFRIYEDTLFSLSSKDFERAVQSKDVNRNLDQSIEKFLLQLSPYLLLQSSHKALEWLINRYHIHQYNQDAVLTLILPYHETKIFVRFVQLLDTKSNSNRWNWLHPIKKPGVALAKQVLYNQCVSNSSTLQFIAKATLRYVNEFGDRASHLNTVFAFFCSTVIGTINTAKRVTESMINAILPTLIAAIESPVLDFRSSAYIIIGYLSTKATIKVDTFDEIICKILTSEFDLSYDMTLLINVMFTNQDHITKMSDSILYNTSIDIFNKLCIHLKKLVEQKIQIHAFTVAFLSSVLSVSQSNSEEFRRFSQLPEILIDEVDLRHQQPEKIIKCVLNSFEPQAGGHLSDSDESDIEILDENDSSGKISQWFSALLKSIENKYPQQFDMVVKELLSSKSLPPKKLKHLSKVLGFKPAVARKVGGAYLFENLNHVNPELRVEAVKYIVKELEDLRIENVDFVRESVIARLNDDNSDVVSAALQIPSEQLAEILSQADITNAFVSIVSRSSRKWTAIVKNAICKFCCSDKLPVNQQTILAVIPHLFAYDNNSSDIAFQILTSVWGKKLELHKNLDTVNPAKYNHQLFNKMAFNAVFLNKMKSFDITFNVNQLNKDSTLEICLYMILKSCSLHNNASIEEITDVLNLLLETVESREIISSESDNTTFSCEIVPIFIKQARHGKIKFEALEFIFSKIIENMNVEKISKPWCNICERPATILLRKLFEIFLTGCYIPGYGNKYSILLQKLLSKFFCNAKEKFDFVANVSFGHILYASDPKDVISPELQLRSLKLLNNFVAVQEDAKWLFESDVVIVMILFGLHNPIAIIRQCVIDIINLLLRQEHNQNDISVQLINELLAHKEELMLDHEQIPQVLNTIITQQTSGNKIFRRNCLLKFTAILNGDVPPYITSEMLEILKYVNHPNAFSQIVLSGNKLLLSLQQKDLSPKYTLDIYESKLLKQIYCRINENTVSTFTNDKVWQIVVLGLKQYKECILEEDQSFTSPSVVIMKQIDDCVFKKIPEGRSKDFIYLITSAGAFSNNPSISSMASKVMKKICLNFADFKPILDGMVTAIDPAACVPKKKKSSVSMLSYQLTETDEWRLGVTLLEYVQNKKKMSVDNTFVSLLFQILNKCLRFEEQSHVEYTKQLILSSLWYYCKKYVDDSDKEQLKTLKSIFDIELIVQCIRGTQNPQTHHHALILLSHAAYMLPEQVLHHTMEIFTFMGSSVLRHDDAYSFQIIIKIIENLVPILVKLDRDIKDYKDKELQKLHNRVVPVLRIFADVVLHVPEHRRLPLYRKLIETLGPSEFLWVFLALLLETHVSHFNDSTEKDKKKNRTLADQESPANRLDFGQNVLLEFPPEICLENFIKLMNYLKSLPLQKDEESMEMQINPSEIFSVNGHTQNQLRHYKYVIITFMNNCLSSSRFIHHSNHALDITVLEAHYKTFIINILTFIQSISKISDEKTAKYWRVMLHHSYDLLDHTNNLLSSQMFLSVTRGLLKHNLQAVRRKSMELLNAKIQFNPEMFHDVDKELLFSLLPALLDIVKTIENNDPILSDIAAQELELNQQTALLSLKLLTRLLASSNPEPFKSVLDNITEYTCNTHISDNVMASVVLCLAELCANLKAHALANLRKFMPALIKVLKKQRKATTPELVLLSTVTAISKIVESLPLFLSPYLQKILYEYSILLAKWQNEDQECSKVSAIISKLFTIRKKIASTIPPRVLVPVANVTHYMLVEKENYAAIGPVMSVLAESFANVTTADFTALQQDLTTFFLSALQLRSYAAEKNIDSEVIDKSEDEVVNALVCLVLKLSETSFRPFYFKIYDWAIRTNVEGHKDRNITFYRLSSAIADKLKGLFVLFAGHFIKNAAELLDSCNNSKTEDLFFDDDDKCIVLIKYILKTLHIVFLYDSQNFLNKERFETLMQPVVDQLENTVGGVASLKIRASETLIPCVSQFAVATADDSLWKLLNYQILLKTRHNDADIRLTALDCLVSMATQLGSSWLPLLAESVPFLAELLEDGDSRIETSTKDAIRKLEQILGEPLEKYF